MLCELRKRFFMNFECPYGLIMMIFTWIPVMAMLVTSVNGVRSDNDTELCAKIHIWSSVVPLGSPVSATCVIRKDCPLVIGQAVQIEWRLGSHLVPGSPVANESDRVSRVVISSFNHTKAVLTCWIKATSQIVAGMEIRAGYPPEAPQNLSCQTNFTSPNTLRCRWDPGLQDTHVLTTYTLHTNIRGTDLSYIYKLPPGVHHYAIPRTDFRLFLDMTINVTAKNDFGEATSESIILEPVSAAKFDPPEIEKIEMVDRMSGCLRLWWKLPSHQDWLRYFDVSLEVRFRTAASNQWNDPPIYLNRARPVRAVEQCRLLHGTEYLAQVRVRYLQSPWSEWSSSKSGVTLETAPTGRLNTWIKVSRDYISKQNNIELFWKPSKQFSSNSRNVWYVVSVRKQNNGRGKVCSTSMNYCTFQLSAREKQVYLRAVNGAGKSSLNAIRIYQPKAQSVILDVAAVPRDNRSLLIQWSAVVPSGLSGYVVEWKPSLTANLSHVQFENLDKNQSSLVLTGSFEPYKPYRISVYPRFKDGIGPPQTVNAYLRQKAPSMVPKIQIKKIWRSQAELTWDEIPLEKRNGIIKDYKVIYWYDKGPVKVAIADPEERKVILENVNTECWYEAFMIVSTFGGSLNGSTISFKTESFDIVIVATILAAFGFGVTLVIIITYITCFSKKKRLKGHIWPAVPDPANSSIKVWTSESTQFIHHSWDKEEPNPIYLSHLSFLDLTTKLSQEKDENWLNNTENTSDLGESICGSPFIPEYSGSNSDSVPYATVLFSSPSNSPLPDEPHVYLRSESTQPLVETEESFSPKCYQNVASNGTPREQCFFGPCDDCVLETEEDPTIVWDDFPFLRALAMTDTEND
ncbi:granulocyte colony-stimulating factor receptor [Kryptolebias marmoratus]|uniref:Colony stimulating factor 3 receptor n=1 Tax=Kryptolebias marmoratus TaxID=37003 RepID=A0A3Q3AQ88_KRYMA|nr:granulocyte colony-stimulating factor receptor [Kryptolebias marmoratus]